MSKRKKRGEGLHQKRAGVSLAVWRQSRYEKHLSRTVKAACEKWLESHLPKI